MWTVKGFGWFQVLGGVGVNAGRQLRPSLPRLSLWSLCSCPRKALSLRPAGLTPRSLSAVLVSPPTDAVSPPSSCRSVPSTLVI